MIFGRRRRGRDEPDELESVESDADSLADDLAEEESEDPDVEREDATDEDEEGGTDWAALDEAEDWRADGPYDIAEFDPEDDPEGRLDLGGMVVRGFDQMELRLQVAEETQQIVSAMMVKQNSALEIAAFAAPRSGGLWAELREEIIEAATGAGGSVGLVAGPFGTELRRLLPVRTPDGEDGYQPSRMWAAQGPRWLLRGVLYGQAAVVDGVDDPAVAELLAAFRSIVVRRGDEAIAPGDLIPLHFPQALGPTS